MKKNILSLLLILSIATPNIAQDNQAEEQQVDETNPVIAPEAPPEDTGNLPVVTDDPEAIQENAGLKRTAEENLKTILLDNFDLPQGWIANIPLDFGISRINYRPGGPQEIYADNNNTVLGVKTIFFRRNYGWMSIDKRYPILIPNIVKNFSMWVQGYDRRHKLFFKVRDLDNNQMRIPAGAMFWRGWKKVISPVSANVVQYNPLMNHSGLEFWGFHIDFMADDIVITQPYYVYFDYLTAVVDFAQEPEVDEVISDW